MVLPLKYPVGTRLTGKVRNLTSFGAFVEIEPGIDGLIHISDMSWTKRVQHPSEVVKKGDTVDVVILNIDADNKRISLGLKQATDDPWLTIGERLPVGTEMRGKVLRPVDKGIVLDLGDDIEAFAPASQMGLAPDQDPETAVVPNQQVVVRVLEVDPIHHRIVVAVIDYPADGIPEPGSEPPPAPVPEPPTDDDVEGYEEFRAPGVRSHRVAVTAEAGFMPAGAVALRCAGRRIRAATGVVPPPAARGADALLRRCGARFVDRPRQPR